MYEICVTKTFANLSIGLAIFDKRRRLVLFNPALLDLTGLSAEFLIGQPTVQSLFDGLREAQILPEPKNYSTWRREILDLEAAAMDGTYHDTWSLPNGQTYRVTGRPHPDGAIAFLFEDISAEISLTRRFRSEIETGQAVIDAMDEAIAVFNASGTMTMTNSALANLWGDQNETSLADNTVSEMARVWQGKTAPSPIWASLRDFTSGAGSRRPLQETILLHDGRQLECRLVPLFGGATMVGFRPLTSDVASLQLSERKVTPEDILTATG